MVIPSIDRVCTQLFKQLNDQFKEGLTQFMAQVRDLDTVEGYCSTTDFYEAVQ